MTFEEYKKLPKWKGKIFMKDEETCFNDGFEAGATEAKEILRGLYFIIKSRIAYENNTGIADEMWRAQQFLKEVSE